MWSLPSLHADLRGLPNATEPQGRLAFGARASHYRIEL